ncbi:DUF6058 family natural product biosynthesis protein [Pontibacter sp. MBLB2868]|uniref:DUF6058 family natural product biosynthesis protein n=1 Tax=Pontibacter sp. MBLB2868 TaxID=3451555 RepID=UPI003F753D38
MTNIEYIKANFIEKRDLLKLTETSSDFLESLISKELVPKASYFVEHEIKISSPLNDCAAEVLKEEYFGKNVIALVNAHKREVLQPNEFKQRFRDNFKRILQAHDSRSFAYGNIFNEKGELIEDKFMEVFEEEWKYYCLGVYGICTQNANEKAIVAKEVAVKKLIRFNKDNLACPLTEEQKRELIELNNEFNQVASLFAPYQRENSSRNKYLDKALENNSLKKLVKNYGE